MDVYRLMPVSRTHYYATLVICRDQERVPRSQADLDDGLPTAQVGVQVVPAHDGHVGEEEHRLREQQVADRVANTLRMSTTGHSSLTLNQPQRLANIE